MNCPSCNHSLPEGARFCLQCGQAISQSCNACGAELPSGARFCLSCGASVDSGVKQTHTEENQFCAGSGKVLKPEDDYFKCMECSKLYLEQFRFEDKPICQSCAFQSGMAQQLEKERSELARIEAVRKARVAEEQRHREQEVRAKAEAERKAREAAEQAEREAEAKRCANALKCPHTGMEFVEVPGGQFDMGDLWGDGDDSEKPIHSVNIQAFLLGKTPVTQAQWQAVMGDNPAEQYNANFVSPDKPVVAVSWEDAQSFIRKLNSRGEDGFRLPSEAEWEYAARSGGKRHKWAGCNSESELTDYAWYLEGNNGQTQPVAQKRPNDLGLHDMSGNVSELCEDKYHDNYQGAPSDGTAWLSGEGTYRVLRGGCWGLGPSALRSADRHLTTPEGRFGTFGFRLARIKR